MGRISGDFFSGKTANLIHRLVSLVLFLFLVTPAFSAGYTCDITYTECAPTYYLVTSSDGTATCEPCPTGCTCAGGTAQPISCPGILVPAGYYLPANSTTPKICPAGGYCPGFTTDGASTTSNPRGVYSCATGSAVNTTLTLNSLANLSYATSFTSLTGAKSRNDCYTQVLLYFNGATGGTLSYVDPVSNRTKNVSYDSAPASILCYYNQYCVFPSANVLTASGYAYCGGWQTSANSNVCSKVTRFKITTTAQKYYATRVPVVVITLNKNGGGSAGTSQLYTYANTSAIYLESNLTKQMTPTDPSVGMVASNPLVVPTQLGMDFKGYYSAASGGDQLVDADGYLTLLGSSLGYNYTTWYAHWDHATFEVSYNLNGGAGTVPTSAVCEMGGAGLDLPDGHTKAFGRPGYRLIGWSSEPDLDATDPNIEMMLLPDACSAFGGEDGTAYAVWKKCDAGSYSVAYGMSYADECTSCPSLYPKSVEGASSNSACYADVSQGSYLDADMGEVMPCGMAGDGYYCPGGTVWNGGSGVRTECPDGYDMADSGAYAPENCYAYCPNNKPGYTISAGYDYYGGEEQDTCSYMPNNYAVTYSCGDGTGTAPASATATYDLNFTPAANTCTRTGYSFAGWAVSGTSDVKAAGVAFKWTYLENKTFTATWNVNSYNCAPGTYLDGVTCKECTGANYCEGGTWPYDGAIHGLQPCPSPYNSGADAGASAQSQCYWLSTTGNEMTPMGVLPCGAGATGYCPGGIKVYYGQYGGITSCPTGYEDADDGASGPEGCYKYCSSKTGYTTDVLEPYYPNDCTYTPINYPITYNANGGTGTTAATNHTFDSTSPALAQNGFSRTGYTFAGWNTKADGSGDGYAAGTTNYPNFTSTNGATVTLYAKWSPMIFLVMYSCGDGTGTAPDLVTVNYDSNFTPAANTCSRTGYTFAGWKVRSNGDIRPAGVAFQWKYTSDMQQDFVAQWNVNSYNCAPGKYLDGVTCKDCTAGHYCEGDTFTYNGGVQGLMPCSAGTYNPNTGSATDDACVKASKGYYVPTAGASEQIACSGPRYADKEGQTQCTECPTATNSTGVTVKSYGYWNTNGQAGDNTERSGCNVTWNAKTLDDGTMAAFSCYVDSGADTYGVNGTSKTCWVNKTNLTCNASYYNIVFDGNASATQYTGNKTLTDLYANVCQSVGTGYWSGADSLTRTQCPANYQDGAGTTAQANCVNSCAAGTQVATANADCTVPTATNWYTDAHDVTYGKTSADLNKVFSCDSDYGNWGTDPEQHAGVTSCYVVCEPGKWVASANAACTDVGNGYYRGEDEQVSQGSVGSRNACSSLSMDTTKEFYIFSDGGRDAETDCYGVTSSGTGVLSPGMADYACTLWPEDRGVVYCPGGIKVYYGTFGIEDGGLKSCPAPYNAGSDGGRDAETDCYGLSTPGHVIDGGEIRECGAAGGGRYCPGDIKVYYNQSGGHMDCPSGYYWADPDASAETDCYIEVESGKYLATKNGWTLSDCACGTYKAEHIVYYGSTSSCTTTTAGYYAKGTGNSSQTKADAGYYAAAGACDQTVVNNGCYGGAGASTACPNNCNALPAPAVTGGTFSSATPRSANTACRYVAPSKTATGCSSITANTVSYSGSAWGSGYYTAKASKGYRVSATGTATPSCTVCAAGTYQGTDGSTATSCTNAADGKYVAGTGASTDVACALGSYSEKSSASTKCVACPAGRTTSGTGTKYNATANTACSVTCANADGVNAWETASWTANSVSNLCTIAASAGCGANYYKTSNSCASCSSGTSGKYTLSAVGTTSVNSCYLKTDAGSYVKTQGAGQTACVSPYYCTGGSTIYYGTGTTTGGNTACTGLGAIYTASDAGASVNTKCFAMTTPGNYVTAKASSQSTCPKGDYCEGSVKVYYGSTGGNKDCPSGYTDGATGYSQQSQCTMNVAGGKFVATAKEASASGVCEKGYAKAAHAVTYGNTSVCDACSGATYQDATGQAECKSCPTYTGYESKVLGKQYWIADGIQDTIDGCQVRMNEPVADSTGDYDGKVYCQYLSSAGNYSSCWVYQQANSCAGGYYYAAGVGKNTSGTATTLAGNVCKPVEAGYWSADASLTRTACASGLVTCGSGTCANEAGDCGRKLHVGNNIVYLRSVKRTTPSLNVKVGSTTYYGNMSTSVTGPVKVNNAGTKYSVVDDYQ